MMNYCIQHHEVIFISADNDIVQYHLKVYTRGNTFGLRCHSAAYFRFQLCMVQTSSTECLSDDVLAYLLEGRRESLESTNLVKVYNMHVIFLNSHLHGSRFFSLIIMEK